MSSLPTNVQLSQTRQPQLLGAYISSYVLAVIAVSLRFSSRKYFSKAGLWLDDYTICASLAVAGGNFVDMLLWVHRGLGKHIKADGPNGVEDFYLSLFICEILYTLTICLTKFSVLLFYWRIFAKSIRIPSMVIALIVTGWAIAVVVTTIFQCRPVRGFWDKSMNPTCAVNVPAFFIGNAVPNIITDWALLFLPVPYIWRLHQKTVQKVALCGVFGLGGFICIISIVRLYIMATQLFHTTSMDVTWLFIGSSTWTAVEVNIGIVSACLPSLRPLLVAIVGDSKIASVQRSKGSGRPLGAKSSRNSTHIIWPEAHQETYIRAGSQCRSERSIKDSWQCQGMNESKDVFVRHDVSVVGEKHES